MRSQSLISENRRHSHHYHHHHQNHNHKIKKRRFFLVISLLILLIFIVFFLLSLHGDEEGKDHYSELNSQQQRMTKESMLSYFKITDQDAAKVTWSHAVNSRQTLTDALNDKTMFLEADILFIESLHSEPIMAHPPQTESDLKFSEWLDLTISKGRGLKLDFKTPNAIEPCLKLLKSKSNEIQSPIILNADIFQGEKSSPVKVQPSDLIDKCQEHFPSGILSIGWTTTKSTQSKYRWRDVFEAYSIMSAKNLLKDPLVLPLSTSSWKNSRGELTFPVRALWATKSIGPLVWLLTHTSPFTSLTIWSPQTDPLSSLESLLIFRRALPRQFVYYDLPREQDEFFKAAIYRDSSEWNRMLTESNDQVVKDFLSLEKASSSLEASWVYSNSVMMSKFGALMVGKGACLTTAKEFKARDKNVIYELRGKFEVFPSSIDPSNNATDRTSYLESIPNTNTSEQNESNSGHYLRISLRTSRNLNTNQHSPGSVNIYMYASGLIKIFIGDRLEQEANLQVSSYYEYLITDVGENEQIHIDMTSYDEAGTVGPDEDNKYSLELFVKTSYEPGQEFYVEQCLTSDSYAVGVDLINISDEISDPQNNNNDENNNNNINNN